MTGLLTDFTELTTSVTESLIRGGKYYFRLRAKNIWGWGTYSSSVAILAARRPLTIIDIRSSVKASDGKFLAVWTAADDQGAPVSQYTV